MVEFYMLQRHNPCRWNIFSDSFGKVAFLIIFTALLLFADLMVKSVQQRELVIDFWFAEVSFVSSLILHISSNSLLVLLLFVVYARLKMGFDKF